MKAESKLNTLFLLGLVAMAVFSSIALYRLRTAVTLGSDALQATSQVSSAGSACAVLTQIAGSDDAGAARAAQDVVRKLQRAQSLFAGDAAVQQAWRRAAAVLNAPLASRASIAAAREAACGLEAEARAVLNRRLAAESTALSTLQGTISFAFAALSLFIALVVLHSYRQARSAARAETEKVASEERWRLALAANNDGLWDWSPPTGVAYFSPQCTSMLGYPEGLPNVWEEWTSRVHPEDVDAFDAALKDHLNRRSGGFTAELRLRCRDSKYMWALVRAQASWDERNRPVRMVGCVTDISERKALEQNLEYKATHDALTGLLNRSGFEVRLRERIERAKELNEPLTLCLCDLDDFKRLNDTHGHQAGDDALRAFAQVLRLRLRAGDMAARLGGDEFGVLLPATTLVSAMAAVERLREAVEHSLIEARLPGVHVSASFGLATLRPGGTEQTLYAAADEALYGAKRDGRNRVRGSGVNEIDARSAAGDLR